MGLAETRSTCGSRRSSRFRTTRTNVGVDLGNLLNSNQATAYQSQYDYVQPNGGSWLDPTTILQPRFARFSLTFSF